MKRMRHDIVHDKPIHTTPPNDDYVAPTSKSILDELLEEFRDEILNVTMVDDEADFNPTKDLEELERLLTKEPQSNFTKIQVHSVIINTVPFIHTQLMSPLYGVLKTSKPCKVDRDIISPKRYAFYLSFPYPVAYLHPKGVYCYFHPHLIPNEGMDTCWVLEDFTTYCCWFNIGVASEDLVLLRKIEENSLSF
ncbi:hypothetical protein Tco_0825509 [Tanacetum coccineum]